MKKLRNYGPDLENMTFSKFQDQVEVEFLRKYFRIASCDLVVKDLNASLAFYQKLGFYVKTLSFDRCGCTAELVLSDFTGPEISITQFLSKRKLRKRKFYIEAYSSSDNAEYFIEEETGAIVYAYHTILDIFMRKGLFTDETFFLNNKEGIPSLIHIPDPDDNIIEFRDNECEVIYNS